MPLTDTIDIIPEGEFREIFNIAAIGRTVVYTNLHRFRDEIIEIVILSVGANTVQVVIEERPLTPPFPTIASQSYIDPGFLLEPRFSIALITGGAAAIMGYVHGRLRDAP